MRPFASAGGTGIGFFVWDSWNSLSLVKVLSAILIIGCIGLLGPEQMRGVLAAVRDALAELGVTDRAPAATGG